MAKLACMGNCTSIILQQVRCCAVHAQVQAARLQAAMTAAGLPLEPAGLPKPLGGRGSRNSDAGGHPALLAFCPHHTCWPSRVSMWTPARPQHYQSASLHARLRIRSMDYMQATRRRASHGASLPHSHCRLGRCIARSDAIGRDGRGVRGGHGSSLGHRQHLLCRLRWHLRELCTCVPAVQVGQTRPYVDRHGALWSA